MISDSDTESESDSESEDGLVWKKRKVRDSENSRHSLMRKAGTGGLRSQRGCGIFITLACLTVHRWSVEDSG